MHLDIAAVRSWYLGFAVPPKFLVYLDIAVWPRFKMHLGIAVTARFV